MCFIPKLCKICNKVKRREHVCGDQSKWCKNCSSSVDYDHKCYIIKDKSQENKVNGYIFFDYECFQINGKYEPNLIVAEKACINCINNDQC